VVTPSRACSCESHIDQAIVDQLAEAMLRMLGIPVAEAARLAVRPLPEIRARQ